MIKTFKRNINSLQIIIGFRIPLGRMKEHTISAIFSIIIVTNITTIASLKVGAGELSKR